MKAKTRNGFPVWYFMYYGISCRQIAPHPMRPYTLEEWRNDRTLKRLFGR